MRYFYGFICVCALSMMPLLGCSGDEGEGGGGSAGTAGTGGTGGVSGIPIPLPQCVSSAYQIVFRGFVEPMDSLLRYMDTPIKDQSEYARTGTKPEFISELKGESGDPYYSRFTWFANAVEGVSDSGETFITTDFVESTGLNPANLDDGISNMEVVLLPWDMTVAESTVVGAGKMSISGLGEDSIRMTIVDFNPWYEGWANYCRFEISGFDFYLNLATPGSEPYGVVVGFKATGSDFTIENGSIIFGDGDTANFTGGYKIGSATATPFDFVLDYSSDPAGLTGTVGSLPASCTIDLATFEVRC